jgi:acyl-coenzyme A synthetase/AMP-(fatty) acid ligase
MSEVLDRATGLTSFWDVGALSVHHTAPAVVTLDETLTYADLVDRVARQARAWPGTGARRLVLVEIEPTVDAVVTYLAALAAGHVVLLAAPGRGDRLAEAWSPDDRARSDAGAWDVVHGPHVPRHDLHPDLGLLMSTSGSTGSPKLVRLSLEAVHANAVDIAAALALDPDDRAVTTLPLHYCYGLSVLHAHLAAGASVLLTDASVVDPALWSSMRTHGVTSLAGVPHTFELLESSDAPMGSVPTLRQVTQAGGRLDPARVRYWAQRGEREGWDLRVMYGQTEATARMAVSAPGVAAHHPSSAGIPVGHGRFRVIGPDGELPAGQVGELHYAGPNVMLGYALDHADLARGRDVTELDTGDLARLGADGTLEVVGRRSSFLKVNGVRLDVEHVEQLLAASGLSALVGGDDERLLALVVGDATGVAGAALVDRSTRALTEATGLPAHRVVVAPVAALPRHPNGKLDRAAIAPTMDALTVTSTERVHGAGVAALVALYAELLARPDTTEDSTFVDLGGDSLSYVELSLHLEQRLGPLPADWPLRPISTLAVPEPPPQSRVARVDTTIVLRAAAILAIVGTHTHVVHLLGGAHILLAVAGYNFARFAASAPTVRETWRRVGGTVARIAVPTFAWVAGVGLLAGTYSPANLVMANWLFGSDTWSSTWRLWFLEALVWSLVALAVLLSVPAVRRLYTRTPFGLVAGLAAVAALARLDVFDLTAPPGRGTAPAVLWLVAIGWAAQVATRRRQRLLLSVIAVATLPGFMDDPVREGTIAAGLLLVVWVRAVPVPRLLVPAMSVLASASLYVYLTHFEVYRATDLPWVNLVLSLGLGLAAWALATRLTARISGWRLRRRAMATPPVPEPAVHRLPQEASR